MNRDDVGMRKAGRDAGFAEEARAHIGAAGERERQGLDGDVAIELDEDDYARKRAALEAHRTQLVVEGDELRLSSGPPFAIGRLERFRPEGAPVPPEPVAEERPDPVTRIVSGVLSVVTGAVVGAITTVAHQSTVSVGEAVIPVGLAVSLAAVLLLLLGVL